MRSRITIVRLVALLAAGCVGGPLFAQHGGNYQPSPRQGGGAMQSLFTSPMGGNSDYVDAYGNSVVVPAQYCDGGPGCYGGECGYGGDCGYEGGPCGPYSNPGYCGGLDPSCYGASPSGGGYGHGHGFHGGGPCSGDRFAGGMGTYPPYEDGLENFSLLPPGRTEQCGPHYWDVRMEAVVMTRDEAFRTPVDFSSQNVQGPIRLSSNELDFDYEGGFRIMGRYDIGPLAVLEFGYWGLENLDSSASFANPDGDTFSLFSAFGLQPDDVTDPNGPIPWTERSTLHSISLESELHNAEINCRRYWVGFNPAVSGTLVCGFRFIRMREDFLFHTEGEAEADYDENIKNDMAGFQTGGDIWVHIREGLRIGFESKVGLMNNHYTLTNTFTATPPSVNGSPDPSFSEKFEKDQPAFMADASADIVWDVCPSWSIRAGYEVLFLNSILLAGENFNTGSVYTRPDGPSFGSLLAPRVPFVNNQGEAFYHGGHLGLEYTW